MAGKTNTKNSKPKSTKMTSPKPGSLNEEQLLEFYGQMVLIREFEKESERQYTRGNVKGFLHVYSGEEAIAVGAINNLKKEDYVVTHYRDHGQALVKGIDPKQAMAELFGKSTGCSKGKGGSMHLIDAEKGFMGGYAIVGGHLPIAVGFALANQYKDENRVTLCFMGDGALNEGEFHECMNLSKIWNLPIIFLCENNLYGMGAPAKDHLATPDKIYKMSEAYDIPGFRVDGNNVVEVYDLMKDLTEKVRNGGGPVFVEAQTYRIQGHSIADPAKYRPDEEVEYWKKKDPIIALKSLLIDKYNVQSDIIEQIHQSAEQEIIDAADFAEQSPFPEDKELFSDVYGV
jgi:pyruvate dehydrogenase E1 component alpha subunit|tara:strand:- start:844 stop:1875 length:1032 start_codon:yes stop_codon:yes gene_type:complete